MDCVNPIGTSWFVDVLEYRYLIATGKIGSDGNLVMMKAGLIPSGIKKDSKATFRLLKTEAKGLKSEKMWMKAWNFDLYEAVSFVGDGQREVLMEIVARIKRPCSSLEAMEIRNQFEKQ